LTDSQNSAFAVFVMLLARMILSLKPNLYIPMSKVHTIGAEMYARLNLCEVHFQSHYADFIYAVCLPVLVCKPSSSYHSPSLCPAPWWLQCSLKQ